jgi:hypothetical protein
MGAVATTQLRRAAILALCILAAPACRVASPGIGRLGGWDNRIDDKPALWGEYRVDAVYALQRDVFLLEVPERTNGLALVAGMEWQVPPGTLRGPTGVPDYLADPKRWRLIAGVAPAGTRMRVEVLRGKGNLRDPAATVHYVKARLLDTERQGQMVDLQALSRYVVEDPESRKVTLAGPNEDFLALAP